MVLKQEDLTIQDLEKCFYAASAADKKYVGVLIEMEGFPARRLLSTKTPTSTASLPITPRHTTTT